jgi:hypothetical protein
VTRTSVGESRNGIVFKETGVREEVTFGRMNVRNLVRTKFENQVSAMCVGICGPGRLGDDVRMATRGGDGLRKGRFLGGEFHVVIAGLSEIFLLFKKIYGFGIPCMMSFAGPWKSCKSPR